LVPALGHHTGGVDMFGFFAARLLLLETLLDPARKISNGIASHAELDEMKCHLTRSFLAHVSRFRKSANPVGQSEGRFSERWASGSNCTSCSASQRACQTYHDQRRP